MRQSVQIGRSAKGERCPFFVSSRPPSVDLVPRTPLRGASHSGARMEGIARQKAAAIAVKDRPQNYVRDSAAIEGPLLIYQTGESE